MSEDVWQRYEELSWEADNLRHGELQVKLREEAVRLADSMQDLDRMFESRLFLINSASFSGAQEKSLTAFSWCLAQYELDPMRYDQHQHTVLWDFKFILHGVDEFPQISLSQIEEMREQMIKLYDQSGYNKRAAYYTKFVLDIRNCDREQACESFELYLAEPRDEMADCIACETATQVEYFILLEKWKQAIDTAEPILNGSQSCVEVPHNTYMRILQPLAMLERYEEADLFREKGYRLIRNNPEFLQEAALGIVYLIHRKNVRAAVAMFEKHLAWTLSTHQLMSKYGFYFAAARLLTHLAEQNPTAKLRLPQEFPLYEAAGVYELKTLIDWFKEQIDQLGNRFNERNGNCFVTEEFAARFSY